MKRVMLSLVFALWLAVGVCGQDKQDKRDPNPQKDPEVQKGYDETRKEIQERREEKPDVSRDEEKTSDDTAHEPVTDTTPPPTC